MFQAEDERNPYLQHEVEAAGPIRLRWMLIRRAEELCTMIEQLWKNDQPQQAEQWLLRLRDILGELLAGITKGNDPLRKTIADLYVFMIQQVQEIQTSKCPETLSKLQHLLAIESETWRQLVERQVEEELCADHHSDNYSAELPPENCGSLSLEA
jgi:flagellin-specific chaperone FliS